MTVIKLGTTFHSIRCCECLKGEHENYDDEVEFVVVRDPDGRGRIHVRGYVCGEHRAAFEIDGYTVEEIR